MKNAWMVIALTCAMAAAGRGIGAAWVDVTYMNDFRL
jgi:hypothetical protein